VTWLAVALLYMTVAQAVADTARVWVPLLVGAAGLLLVTRRCAKAGRHRRRGPDTPDDGAP
jgi:hypothetical protein